MAKLFTRASVAGASLSGANLKATLTALWDALNSSGLTDASRAAITTSATLATTQCGLLLVDATSASIVLTLPTSGASTDDAIYTIRRIDSSANSVTVVRGGTDTIEGATTAVVVPPAGTTEVQLPGGSTNWRVLMLSGGTALAARNNIGVSGISRVSGLVGNPTAATPLTKYDLQAQAVTLRDASGATVSSLNTATLTCDLGLTGPAANGRDQSAAFTASSWIYLYFIWNGATLATLASTAVPANFTGSTLPSGYTHWAFATALRWNASSNIIPALTNGHTVTYDLADGGVNKVLTNGVATTMTAVSLAGFVPPNALLAHLGLAVSANGSTLGPYNALFRPTGSSNTGKTLAVASVQVTGANADGRSEVFFPLGTSQQIDYKISFVPSTSGGVSVEALGFVIPNGDA